ncbi:hypothetical protein [Rhizobium mesosinicum]|uniref:SPW repeat-containing integral membrane domain-containing protein n=1 Tax=Rhizobium mesosinicum TaxID=335017 RepID=A0ABS7GR77_9HYPH|nr:hypothetical protein [Rhizobium mesosinicum]MBW9052462.1 hypothetical protein [Rhizobium mesosinicum]
MRFVPSFVHGLADYVCGAFLLAGPILLQEPEPARHLMMIIGSLVLLNSVLTDHEAGIHRLLPLRIHLCFDAMLGAAVLALPLILTLSPVMAAIAWLFGLLTVALATTTIFPHRRFD